MAVSTPFTLASPWRIVKAVALLALASPTFAKPAVPNFEVKFAISPNALTSGHPSAAFQSAFKLGSSPDTRSYGYYDTSDLALNAEGWAVRLRHKEGEDFELVYKKRFEVAGNSKSNLDSALKTAEDAGFAKSDDNYSAQVDWTYSKRTLSFSLKKKTAGDGYQASTLPDSSTGLQWLSDNIPGKLQKWKSNSWGAKTLDKSRLHGPVKSDVYTGTWQGVEVEVEVLPVKAASGQGTETTIELSFKTDTDSEATSLRTKATAQLKAAGWLVEADLLKTNLILNRY